MKHLLFVILFCNALSLSAQTATDMLSNLKGTWYQEGREIATYADWQPTDDSNWLLRTWQIHCGVTTEISRASIQIGTQETRMAVQTPADGQERIFRLTKITDDGIIWENSDPNVFPKQVTWSFSSDNDLVIQQDNETSIFRHQPKNPAKWTFSALAGVGVNNQQDQHLLRENWRYQPGPSAEMAIQVNVRGKSRLGFNLELGISRRQVHAAENWWSDDNTIYHRKGTYRNSNLYLACMPEWTLRKDRGSIFAGVFSTINHSRTFEGTTVSNAKPETATYFQPGNRRGLENGLLAGFSWRLPAAFLPSFRPSLYCRGMYGLGAVKVRGISTGVIFRL